MIIFNKSTKTQILTTSKTIIKSKILVRSRVSFNKNSKSSTHHACFNEQQFTSNSNTQFRQHEPICKVLRTEISINPRLSVNP